MSDIEYMLHDGLEHARNGRYDEALAIARELEWSRFTGCFEIKAVAQSGMGDLKGAIETLQQSIRTKPVWRNGHLLGIYLSDSGRYEEALTALDDCLAMHAPEPKATAYNKAIALDRLGRSEDATTILSDLAREEDANEPDIAEKATAFLDRLKNVSPKLAPAAG